MIKLVLILIALIATPALAENKFIILRPQDPIPVDKFIYIIVNIENGERLMGYSKSELEFNNDGKIIGGVRNGGHTFLLMHAMGFKEFDHNAFEKTIPPFGQGKWVGGGFIKSSMGVTLIHPAMSHKAAGGLGTDVKDVSRDAMNPRLPRPNKAWSAMIPEEYARLFYTTVGKATGLPLWVDTNFFASPHFKYNAAKHANDQVYYTTVTRAVSWMHREVHTVNDDLFPSFQLPKQVSVRLHMEKMAASCANIERTHSVY